jgi:hypothetical protein
MNNVKQVFGMLVSGLLVLVPVTAFCGAGGGSTSAEVSGVVGLHPVEAQSCVAIWVPIPADKALSGFSWYNNDGNTVFPQLLLESGTPNNPVTLAESTVMAENLQGVSSGWSEAEFDDPVACLSEGLYLLIRYPEASEYTADGTGGGAAIGYRTDGQGYPGWISADGQEWIAFQGDFGFALQPHFVAATEATIVMQGAQRDPQGQVAKLQETTLFRATPNPFNPSTKLRFNLAQGGRVDLAIYNLRGELVKRLIGSVLGAGPHEVTWAGRDNNGRGVASGVYFARMEAGKIVVAQRLVLVQ